MYRGAGLESPATHRPLRLTVSRSRGSTKSASGRGPSTFSGIRGSEYQPNRSPGSPYHAGDSRSALGSAIRDADLARVVRAGVRCIAARPERLSGAGRLVFGKSRVACWQSTVLARDGPRRPADWRSVNGVEQARACSRFVLFYAAVGSRRSGHSHRKKRSASRIESTRIVTTTSAHYRSPLWLFEAVSNGGSQIFHQQV